MKLIFLGSRSSHAVRSVQHHRQSALLIEIGGQRIMLDCGRDWRDAVAGYRPDAIILTHAHDDHSGGLAATLPCPVIASAETWQALPALRLDNANILSPGDTLNFNRLRLTPYPVQHSLRAPAVGLRIESTDSRFCYCPDIAALSHTELLQGCSLYIGDGTSWDQTLLREESGEICGHAPMPRQLQWCQQAGISQVIFTHCGKSVVAQPKEQARLLQATADKLGLAAQFAKDGLICRFQEGRLLR